MKGYHLLITAKNCSLKTIDDMDYIKETIFKLIKNIDMEPLCDPIFSREKPGEPKGISAIFPITTSHISIHTFTEDLMFFLDVFSCKMFNPQEVKKYIQKKFYVKEIKTNFQVR